MDKKGVVYTQTHRHRHTYRDTHTDTHTHTHTHTHAMEYYSAIKKNEILPFVTAWTDLEGTKLSEISQMEKDKYYMISLKCVI